MVFDRKASAFVICLYFQPTFSVIVQPAEWHSGDGRGRSSLKVQIDALNDSSTPVRCGTIPKPSEVKAILEFKPERIGHGTCIHPHLGGSSELWEILLQSKIPVEACLTSNVKSSTVKHYEDHHFQFMFKHQHPITLGVSSKCYTFVTSISNRPFGVVYMPPVCRLGIPVLLVTVADM
uniref:Adenosine deaminase domain-containing protein n=1 Tax=Timema bartmani TaxID=61472 RepID=A0A7R9I4I5_9NEOP|nr:unnamed protein product [Timema bartmani]